MKKHLLFWAFSLLPFLATSQAVSINEDGSVPNLRSILDVKSNTKGLLAPRMNTADRLDIAVAGTEEGLIVFDTDLDKYMVYTGVQWETIGDGLWLPHLNGAYRLNRIAINNTPITRTNMYVYGNGPVGPDTSVAYFIRLGTSVVTEGGTNFSANGIDAGIKSYSLWGNKYSSSVAAYSDLDHNLSTALVAGKTDATVLAMLGYKETASQSWAGHFTGDVRVSDQVGIGVTPGNFTSLHVESPIYDRTGYYFNTKATANTTFGVYAGAYGTGSGDKRGGSFEASGGTGVNIGVRAFASGGTTNWAGYFAGGNVYAADNVAIGTTTMATGYKLSVNGKIISTELRIQDLVDWPDYVFEETYPLMSLYDLESRIQSEKHLPGIPSAEEVSENGILVGDMQRLLLQKIEELTLYTIAQQKQIDALEEIVTSNKKWKKQSSRKNQ